MILLRIRDPTDNYLNGNQAGTFRPNGTSANTSQTPLLEATKEKKINETMHALEGHTHQPDLAIISVSLDEAAKEAQHRHTGRGLWFIHDNASSRCVQ